MSKQGLTPPPTQYRLSGMVVRQEPILWHKRHDTMDTWYQQSAQ